VTATRTKPKPKSQPRQPKPRQSKRKSETKSKARQPNPRQPAPPVAAPFPFLGQGDAHYYEWFEMWIWFAEPVPRARRKELLADAPPPCALDAQWPDPSLLWASTGDQWIHQHLIETYGTKAAKARNTRALARQAAGGGDDGDDDYLDDLIAGGEEQVFNAHIERWLHAMHAKRPILFAARREDGEAGGTQLGRWHAASRQLFLDRVAPALAPLAKAKLAADDLRRAPIAIALSYLDAKSVPPAIRKLGERG
jgi:hypothetical protein